MNERIKELRKTLGLSGEKFGERLGVGKTAISKIERGENNLTSQMIKLICREFNVDYIWLTTGNGEMFFDYGDDTAELIDQIMYGEDERHKSLLSYVANMNNEDLDAAEHIIDSVISFFSQQKN